MKPDEQRMRDVLVDTIRLLCRTGVEYSRRLRVQGLLGITVDDEHVFLIHVDDFIARNCADADNRLCPSADDYDRVDIGHVDSDVETDSANPNHNALEDIVSNDEVQHPLGQLEKHPNHLSLTLPTCGDVMPSVSLSKVSSVSASSEAEGLQSLQLTSQNAQSVSSSEKSITADSCQEFDGLVSGGNTAVESQRVDSDGEINTVQSSAPNDVEVDHKNELKMETDAGKENIAADGVVMFPPCGAVQLGMTLYTAATAGQNQHGLLNLDDVESTSGDTNEDGDSEHSSESEEVPDCVTVPRLDLVSSLQYDPRALVGNAVPSWQVNSVQQRSLSDSSADAVAIQPAVLTGVVHTGPSQVSAYYQQQVVYCSILR